jgi:Domain of unknown function (DUF4139)
VRASSRLPVKSVVLYRSGVGYFERSGKFDGKRLKFSVRKEEVGDFLASLTAVEKGTGGVRSIAFSAPEAKPPVPTPAPDPDGKIAPPPAPAPTDERVDVELLLGSDGEHAVDVAYVVGSPIWRPSYRVVLDKGEQALLQAWAVVQNMSGEDWNDVRLSLTTGAPISFRSDLGTPITPERPLVTDTGEVVSAVPVGEVAVAQSAAPPAPPPEPKAEASAAYDMASEADEMLAAAARPMRSYSKAAKKPMPSAPAAAPLASALERAVESQATSAQVGAQVTRYDLNAAVTVPNGGSTMVAIVSARVPGEKAHLFAPDGGVPLSYQHPFSVVRLGNGSGAVLEKGPISVMADGAFLGQGVLDTLPKDAQAFVPFALEKAVVVEPSESWGEQQGSLVKVQRGVVTIERFSQRTSRYRVRNGTSEPVKVYVRHARWGEAELVAPPEGTELLAQKALVPITVAAGAEQVLEVLERTPVRVDLSFAEQPAADAVAVWLSGAAADQPQSEALKRALAIRSELMSSTDKLAAAEQEQATLMQNAEETRGNLKAIEKVTSAADLRGRLVQRLKQLDQRIAELTKQIVDARTKQSELTVRLNEALDSVSLSVPGKS